MENSSSEKYKICIVSEQLAGGGAERCAAVLSHFFEKHNCKVNHVLVLDKIEYDYAGEILNLGKLKKEGFNLTDRFQRFFTLCKFFRTHKFGYIIDTRVKNNAWQEFVIARFVYNAPTIVMVHSYMTEMYFPKFHWLAKNIYKKCRVIVAVSNKIEEKIRSEYNYNQVKTIYNPIDFNYIEKQSEEIIEINFNYILAVGNMYVDVKQFDKLIKVYSKSDLPNQNIKLIIIGEGILREGLQQSVEELNLSEDVIFTGSLLNPFPYYKQALFTVLSSKNEGFPTVLLESLACETPVVSFDCFSGPSEIIHHRENGLLVENQNEEKLAEAMNEMVFNEKLYYHCKANAKQSVARFDIENIGQQWLTMMKIK